MTIVVVLDSISGD